MSGDQWRPAQQVPGETYPFNAPCEYCGERIVDHSPSELQSCVLDLEVREQEAEALKWWRSQQ